MFEEIKEEQPVISAITEIELLCWKTATEKDLEVRELAQVCSLEFCAEGYLCLHISCFFYDRPRIANSHLLACILAPVSVGKAKTRNRVRQLRKS